jgi:predicted phosphoribosyltransferase
MSKRCELCEAAKLTTWYHDDDVCWVAECEICAVPMVVWRRHGTDPPETERQHMSEALATVADRVLGARNWSFDGVMRQIPDHFHVHARDRFWWQRRMMGIVRKMSFRDRTDAGRQLAERLEGLGVEDPVVEGMARGGVPVGFEIALKLGAPLDVVVVRKLGHPAQPELGMGALSEGGVRVVNDELVARLGVPDDLIDRVASQEQAELERRLAVYRGARPPVEIEDRTVVLVDDGLATGFTALAALRSLRERGARRCVLAVPVAPPGAVAKMESVADQVVCLAVTERFFGISEWYSDFRQVSDDEVVALLERSRASGTPS